jgi:hypothetical protein
MAPSSDTTDPYILLPATPADAPSLITLSHQAFTESLIFQKVYDPALAHLTPREELFAWEVKRLEKKMSDPDSVYFKIVLTESPEELVGYAGWRRPGHFVKKEDADAKAAEGVAVVRDVSGEVEKDEGGYPACMNAALQGEFAAGVDKHRKEIWGDDSNYWCKLLPERSEAISNRQTQSRRY